MRKAVLCVCVVYGWLATTTALQTNATGCQQLRHLLQRQVQALGQNVYNLFIPTCQQNGEFEKIQCNNETGACWCVDKLGFELPGTKAESFDLVNCTAPKKCAGFMCRMLCPYSFELDDNRCPLCECRNPCKNVKCPAGQDCQTEEVPCKEDSCPPLPTCKRPRSLDDMCPLGKPLSSPDNGRPFLCGMEPNKPQCPPKFFCDVQPANDYGVCCSLNEKQGQCPEIIDGECPSECISDSHCEGDDKCCSIDSCGKVCAHPLNTTLCQQQKAVVELLVSSNPFYQGYIPQCTEKGDFEPKQCSSNGRLCWCVNSTGIQIQGTLNTAENVLCGRRGKHIDLFAGDYECTSGTPLLHTSTAEVVTCETDDCPASHICEKSLQRETGICCSRPVVIESTKQGTCPNLDKELNCGETNCTSDHQCEGEMKCCSSKNCGSMCAQPKRSKIPTTCQHLVNVAAKFQATGSDKKLAIPVPSCHPDGSYKPVQCEDGNCWCVDEFGVKISNTDGVLEEEMNCTHARAHSNCMGLICRLGCDYGFETDENGCPECTCRNPCQDASCPIGYICKMTEVECSGDWCPLVPQCVTEEHFEEPLLSCPDGDPLMHENDSPVTCDLASKYRQCPESHYCVSNTSKGIGICCPVSVKTSCEVRRESKIKESSQYPMLTFIPRCTTDTGDWEPVQCLDAIGMCWCVDSEGHHLPNSLIRGTPDCTSRNSRDFEDTPICENGDPVYLCPRNLCENKICLAYPNATCRINPCGRCKAEFYDEFNHIVDCFEGLTACLGEMQEVLNSHAWSVRGEMLGRITADSLETAVAVSKTAVPLTKFGNSSDAHKNLTDGHDATGILLASESKNIKSRKDDFIENKRKRVSSLAHFGMVIGPRIAKLTIHWTGNANPSRSRMLEHITSRDIIPAESTHKSSVKLGMCPAPSLRFLLHKLLSGCPNKKCYSDVDCPDLHKCCLDLCGMNCVEAVLLSVDVSAPSEAKADLDHQPSYMTVTTPLCSRDGGFSIVQREGELSWCVDQYGNPLHDTLTKGSVKCDRNGSIIERMIIKSVCPSSVTHPKVCKDECQNTYCPLIPDAICVADPCNNCAVSFIDKKGEKVECKGKCSHLSDSGTCFGLSTHYFYNQTAHHCEPFVYSGCGGNSNNFNTLEDCQKECEKTVPVCEQPQLIGTCHAHILRWFYNKASHQCEQFYYSGCGGNSNNFRTKKECEARCPDLVLCPWTEVIGQDLKPCSRSKACSHVSCGGYPEAVCMVDSCSCHAYFLDANGKQVTCDAAPSDSVKVVTSAVPEYTRCQSMYHNHVLGTIPSYAAQCDEDGNFLPMQCALDIDNVEQCWCVDEAGKQIQKSGTFPRGKVSCDPVKIKHVVVLLAFKHNSPVQAKESMPRIKRLIKNLLHKMSAETENDVDLQVRTDATDAKFTLTGNNKENVAFQLEEMVKNGGIKLQLEETVLQANYHKSQFYHEIDSLPLKSDKAAKFASSVSHQTVSSQAVIIIVVVTVLIVIIALLIGVVIIHKRRSSGYLNRDSFSNVVMAFSSPIYDFLHKKDDNQAPEMKKESTLDEESHYEDIQNNVNNKLSETNDAKTEKPLK